MNEQMIVHWEGDLMITTDNKAAAMCNIRSYLSVLCT
jgi:hypothetical protein